MKITVEIPDDVAERVKTARAALHQAGAQPNNAKASMLNRAEKIRELAVAYGEAVRHVPAHSVTWYALLDAEWAMERRAIEIELSLDQNAQDGAS